MASKKDLRSYFNLVSEKKKKKDSAVSISEIIVSETSDVSQAEVDMAREQVKKQVMQRKSYQVIKLVDMHHLMGQKQHSKGTPRYTRSMIGNVLLSILGSQKLKTKKRTLLRNGLVGLIF